MKITIVCVGKIKEKFFRDAISEYSKRLSKFCKLNVIEVDDEKTPDGASLKVVARVIPQNLAFILPSQKGAPSPDNAGINIVSALIFVLPKTSSSLF